MSNPSPTHDPENELPEDILNDEDDNSDIEVEQRLDAERKDLDRQADIFNNGYGL